MYASIGIRKAAPASQLSSNPCLTELPPHFPHNNAIYFCLQDGRKNVFGDERETCLREKWTIDT